MNYQLLATISDQRQITHEAGEVVHINWDGHQFRFKRSDFSHFARILELGTKQLYAGKRHYSVVSVDDNLREVWIEKTCLTLTHCEYRALLNAILKTETRLHGFRSQKDEEVSAEPTISYCLPCPIQFYWN